MQFAKHMEEEFKKLKEIESERARRRQEATLKQNASTIPENLPERKIKEGDARPQEKRARRELKACEKAYRWIVDLHPDFIQICEILGIEPGPIKTFVLSDGALEIRNQFYCGVGLCAAKNFQMGTQMDKYIKKTNSYRLFYLVGLRFPKTTNERIDLCI